MVTTIANLAYILHWNSISVKMNTLNYTAIFSIGGTGYKVDSSGKEHNAPSYLPLYCNFTLVELRLAQFDYILRAEM
jgi:hypothetical protein